METFTTGLLADQNLFVGRVDGRYTGPAVAGSLADDYSYIVDNQSIHVRIPVTAEQDKSTEP